MYKFSTRKGHDAFYAKQIERERLIARVNKLAQPRSAHLQVYRAVDFAAVPEFVNTAAREMLDYCYRKLGGLNLAIAWVERSDGGGSVAFISNEPTAGKLSNKPLLFWIRCDMPLDEILLTIAHEAHHCWYGRGPGRKFPYKTHAEQWEAGADAFARCAVSEIAESRTAHDDICALRGLSAALSATRQRMPARRNQPLP